MIKKVFHKLYINEFIKRPTSSILIVVSIFGVLFYISNNIYVNTTIEVKALYNQDENIIYYNNNNNREINLSSKSVTWYNEREGSRYRGMVILENENEYEIRPLDKVKNTNNDIFIQFKGEKQKLANYLLKKVSL